MSVILTVKQLNMYVRSMLENDKYLRQITVVGEISGFKSVSYTHLDVYKRQRPCHSENPSELSIHKISAPASTRAGTRSL